MTIEILSIIFGTAGVVGFIQFLINRRDNRKDLLKTIDKKLDKIEKDNCRTQLLLLLSDYPRNDKEILELAQHYFFDLKGDWYMSSLFAEWLKQRGIDFPPWFDHT